MESLEVFTVRDLKQRPTDLVRAAEERRLSLITNHGRPAILALPFDDWLLSHGVNRALALHLVQAGQVSISQGARISGLALEDFIALLGEAGVAAVDYDPDELTQELAALSEQA